MLIRSQNKKVIANLSNLDGININEYMEQKGKYFINFVIGPGGGKLGEYSTEEKAIKVLDMIQDAYIKYGTLVNGLGSVQSVYNIPKVFEMPQDNEV